MRRLGVVASCAVMALSLFAQGNAAGAQDIEWCYEDPVVVTLGAQFKVVAAAHTQASAITGYTYVLEVPSNAQGRTRVNWPHGRFPSSTVLITYTGAAWSGSGSFPVNGTVTVGGPSGADVSVKVSGPTVATATFSGSTNTAVSFSATVTPGASSGASGADAQ